MPLNRLENFIKNTEGRILYVNPSDLDATDSIDNQGNSLTKPFKTIQRALIESARFSYLRGSNNDLVEKTTILLFPGEHVIDNRPGYRIKNVSGSAIAVAPSAGAGSESPAGLQFGLSLESSFDLTDPNNQLYKFNSVNGGVIVPRGTSLVGLDLRKTKIRPKYVPNPTDPDAPDSAIFRITGTCYFWQFTFFDGLETGLVYTDPVDSSENNQSTPTFSHHKLTCFEYADGVNKVPGFELTDLDMYYAKLSNAYNTGSGRDIDQKYPALPLGFAKQRAEWEIVGAFASDPINISTLISGDGFTPTTVITVTTATEHGLTAGTPIKIKGVGVEDYNISTKVTQVLADNQFTYILPAPRINLDPAPPVSGATITIETDTVSGASPYIFNVSLRSVWGMQGMHANGKNADGFRSMVVAQFTAISLQKDDRAFVKYNKTSRKYEGINITKVTAADLSAGSSSTDIDTVYHFDSEAVYRPGWQTTHIKQSNDAVIQIVSVFAIGFHKHFYALNGADASITNSNSNFGQFSLFAEGFKKEAFTKDDKGYITAIVPPKAIVSELANIDWISLDVGLTTSVGISSHLYLYGFTAQDDIPPTIIQGYRVGSKNDDRLYVNIGAATSEATIYMVNEAIGAGSTQATGTNISEKRYRVTSGPDVNNIFTIGFHDIKTGESVRIFSDNGDLPENLVENTLYYAIYNSNTTIKLASSKTNADNGTALTVYGGTALSIVSAVSDKQAGDIGHPVQYDPVYRNWFIHVNTGNQIYNALRTEGVRNLTVRTDVAYVKRFDDSRSLDDKLYKVQVVIPKEAFNSKDPTEGFIIQESSSTGPRANLDLTTNTITDLDFDFQRNPGLIATCTHSSGTVTVLTELPHNLKVGDVVNIKKVKSSTNLGADDNIGFNGTFEVTTVADKQFQYNTTDVDGLGHSVGTYLNDNNTRDVNLPRFERNDLRSNIFIYRKDVITPYIYQVQDGIYQLYLLNSDNSIEEEFTETKYSQSINDFYPQADKDNIDDNPPPAKTYAKRSPLGAVVTNDLRNSITRETIDKFTTDLGFGLRITGVTTSVGISTLTLSKEHNLSGIATVASFAGGNGYNNGTFYNVKLFNNGTATWDGATAKVNISGGTIRSVDLIAGGSGYTNGEELDFDTATIGSGVGAGVTVSIVGLSSALGDTVQVTGIGTTSGGYFRISSFPAKNQIAIHHRAGVDPRLVPGQYLIHVGPTISVTSSTFDATTGITTFTCASAHGLLSGNSFTVRDASNINLGSFFVKEKVGVNTFSAITQSSLTSPAFVLKSFYSANNANPGDFGGRAVTVYANETLRLNETVTTQSSFKVEITSGISTTSRFPVGSYIQIDNEIMRVTSSTLTGTNNDKLQVARGQLGTLREDHQVGSLIKKIRPIAVEFRRPSVVRASGHTFEYLGYGPGNYSTGLPQVQVKTLSEQESYLAQAQETSGGTIAYTGMNNDGDFFIGNTKYSSSSGTQTTFALPVPTVRGQDTTRLSVVFDEVLVKERIRVEGGSSNTALSQFDGPVTFNNEVKVNGPTIMDNTLKVTNELSVTNTTQSVSKDTGAVLIDGGVGIDRNVFIGENIGIAGSSIVTGISTFVGVVNCSTGATFRNVRIGLADANTINSSTGNLSIGATTGSLVAITTHTRITGILSVTDDITAFYSSDYRLKDNITPIDDPLAKVLSISGNTFTWNDKSHHTGEDVGVVAQEIREVLPQIVTERDNGYLAVDYQKIVPLLIEAIKELNAKVENLEYDFASLQKLLDK
jgi:hypothetical protein